jgi:hypothetical protein
MDNFKANAEGPGGFVEDNTDMWQKYLRAMDKFKENQKQKETGHTTGSLQETSAMAEKAVDAGLAMELAGATHGVAEDEGNEVNGGGSASADNYSVGVVAGLDEVNANHPSSIIHNTDHQDIDLNFETSQSMERTSLGCNLADIVVNFETQSSIAGNNRGAPKSDIVIRFSNDSEAEAEAKDRPSPEAGEVKGEVHPHIIPLVERT